MMRVRLPLNLGDSIMNDDGFDLTAMLMTIPWLM
jgi:hypothetical protein